MTFSIELLPFTLNDPYLKDHSLRTDKVKAFCKDLLVLGKQDLEHLLEINQLGCRKMPWKTVMLMMSYLLFLLLRFFSLFNVVLPST